MPIESWPPRVARACLDMAPRVPPLDLLERLMVKILGHERASQAITYGAEILTSEEREIVIETLDERAALMDPETH